MGDVFQVPEQQKDRTAVQQNQSVDWNPGSLNVPTNIPSGAKVIFYPKTPTPARNQVSLPPGSRVIYNHEDAQRKERGMQIIEEYVKRSENPDEASAKINSSVHLAKELNMDPAVVFENFDSITEKYYGRKVGPLNAWESIKVSWDTGEKTTELGHLGYQQMMNVISTGEFDEDLAKQIEELRASIPPEDAQKRSLPVQALKAAAEMAPLMLEGVRAGSQQGLAYGTGGATVAALAGQAGPQAVLPEEVVTVPTTFASLYAVGQVAGTMENIGRAEAGLAFEEIIALEDEEGNRISPRIAAAASFGIGAINAGIEMLQIGNIPGVDRILAAATRNATKKLLIGGGLKEVAKRALKTYGTSIVTETAQEIVQESTNIVLAEVAKEINNRVNGTSFTQAQADEVLDRLGETAIQSALAFSVMGIPGTVGGAIQDRAAQVQFSREIRGEVDRAQKIVEAMEKELTDKPLAPDATPEQVVADYIKDAPDEVVDSLIEKLSSGAEIAEGPGSRQPWEMTTAEFEESETQRTGQIKSVTPGKYTPAQEKVVSAVMERSNIGEQQAGLVAMFMEMGARGRGMDLGTFVDTYYTNEIFSEATIKTTPEGRVVRGYQKLLDDTKNLIAIGETADFGTFIHEVGHSYFNFLNDQQVQKVRDWTGFQGEDWFSPEGRQAQEQFADGFIEYLRTGQAKDAETRTLFQQFKDFLQEVYAYLSRTIQLNDDIRQVYNEILGLESTETSTETQIAQEAAERTADTTANTTDDDIVPLFQVDAWHGSPHRFDRFTTKRVGTGEGAQAFGWGLYFTDKEEIARFYAENTAVVGSELMIDGINRSAGMSPDISPVEEQVIIAWNQVGRYGRSVAELQKQLKENYAQSEREDNKKSIREALRKIEDGSIKINTRKNLYKVTIHKGKRLSEYSWMGWYEEVSDGVIKLLREKFPNPKTEEMRKIVQDRRPSWEGNPSGEVVYDALTYELRDDMYDPDATRKASMFLLENGIDGIRYPTESLSGRPSPAMQIEDPAHLSAAKSFLESGYSEDSAFEGMKEAYPDASEKSLEAAIREAYNNYYWREHSNYVVFDENAVTIEDHILFQTEQLANRNMATLHNLTPGKILEIDKLGGMPMPSIAITRRDIPFNQFGTVTLVADEQVFSEAYNRDVWSPTVPRPEYTINNRKKDQIDREFYRHKRYPSNLHSTTMENLSGSDFSSPGRLAESLQRSGAVQAAYLVEKRIDLPEFMKAPEVEEMDFLNLERMAEYLKTVERDEDGEIPAEAKADISRMAWKDWVAYIKSKDKGSKRLLSLIEGGPSSLERYFDDNGLLWHRYMREIRNAAADINRGEKVPDYNKRDRYLEEKTAGNDFRQWLEEKLSPMFSDPYIKIGREKLPYTAENVLNWMLKQKATSSQSTFMDIPNLGKIASLSADSTVYREKMKEWGKKLQNPEAVEKQTKIVSELDNTFLSKVFEFYKWNDSWESNTDARKALFEYAKKGYKKRSPARMATAFRKYDFDVSAGDTIVSEALDLIDAVMDVPVDYLEAKPRRIVGLNEFSAALIPESTENKDVVKETLEKHSVEVIEYDNTDEGRFRKLQEYFEQNPGILFQTSAHEDAVRQAVEDGKPVPERVLQEYADRTWAQKELERRAAPDPIPDTMASLYDDARMFDDKAEFRQFVETTFFLDDELKEMSPAEFNEFIDTVWGAVHEKYVSRAEANQAFLESMQEKHVIANAFYEMVQRGFDGGFGLNKVESGIIVRVGTEHNFTDRQYAYILEQMAAHPERYREAINFYDPARTDAGQLQYENMMAELEAAKEQDTEEERKADRLRMNVMRELGINSIDEIDDDLFQKFMKGIARREEIEKAYKDSQKEVSDLEEKVQKLDQEILEDEKRIRKMSEAHDKVIKENVRLRQRAQTEARKELAKLKKLQAERRKALRERKAMREQMQRLAKLIMRKPGPSIHLDEKRAIRKIQAAIDPAFRSAKTIQARREALLADSAGYTVPAEVLEIARKKTLNDFTMDDLELIYRHILGLTRIGKAKRDAQVAAEWAEVNTVAGQIISQVLKGEPLDLQIPTNAKETQKFSARKAAIIQKLETNKPLRIFEWIQGRNEHGPMSEFFYWKVNEAHNEKLRRVNVRKEKMKKTLDDLGITVDSLGREIQGPNGTYTADKVISMYVAVQNQKKMEAAMKSEGMSAPEMQLYITKLTPQEKALGEAIIEDYAENYPELAQAFNDYMNEELGSQENYTPIVSLEVDARPRDEELARRMIAKEAVGKHYTERGFTKERKGGSMQIILGEFSLWQSMVEKQEHFVTHAQHVRQMNRVMGNRNLKVALKQKLDYEIFRWLQHYVNDVAQTNIHAPMTNVEKAFAGWRHRLAVVHLSMNLPVIGRQVWSYPNALGFVDADIWVKAPIEFAHKSAEIERFIWVRSPQVVERTMDPIFEEAKALSKGKAENTRRRIAEAPMKWIGAVDKATCMITWKAAYDTNIRLQQKEVDQGTRTEVNESEAIRHADTAFLKTQPQAQAKDLAWIYRQGEGAKIFLMFSQQLNQLWNVATADMPMYWKNKQWKMLTYQVTGYLMAAVAMGVFARKRLPDDPLEFGEDLIVQIFNTIPFIGKEILSLASGWDISNPSPLVTIENAWRGWEAFKGIIEDGANEKDIRRMVRYGGQFAAEVMALPFTGPRRAVKAVDELINGNWEDSWKHVILGGKPEEEE